MERDTEYTKVIIRRMKKKHGGDLIAFFPEIPADMNPSHCQSYQHVGQHGCAALHFIRDTKPVYIHGLKGEGLDGKQVFELVKELEGLGYRLKMYQRVTPQMDTVRRAEIKRLRDARNIVDGEPDANAGAAKPFTVIGMYEDTGQIFSHFVRAADAHAAMAEAAAYPEFNDELVIVGAVPGGQELYGPGCDNDKTAYACDLAPKKEG